jgi:hypothetical protein
MRTKKSEALVTPLQAPLLVETWATAVDAIAYALGGRKALALEIWPAKGDAAERWLDDCLNPERAAKLSLDELMHILRIGHANGVHTLISYITDGAGYTRPSPVAPADRQAELHQTVVRATAVLDRAVTELKRLQTGRNA